MAVTYTDEEAASLSGEQFDEYMKGGDPLGKLKKKKAEEQPTQEPPATDRGLRGIFKKRNEQATSIR